MSSTLKLDRVHGLKEILAFDGEASTSKPDIDKQAGYQREVGTRFDEPKTVTVEEISFEIQKMSRVVFSGYAQRSLYRQLLSINKSFS
jgi:hypothetical protein